MSRLPLHLLLLVAVLLALPAASAHERYTSEDGSIVMVIGEQGEPVYTYDFTNLDLIVSDNATGEPITGVEETLEATLIAPNGEELSLPLQPQHGTEGRYQFVEDYVLTMPGQYQVRLDGTINDVDVSGTYLLPGPRGDVTDIAFPHTDVADLRELQERTEALEAELAELRSQLETQGATGGSANAEAPVGFVAALGAIAAAMAISRWRRSA